VYSEKGGERRPLSGGPRRSYRFFAVFFAAFFAVFFAIVVIPPFGRCSVYRGSAPRHRLPQPPGSIGSGAGVPDSLSRQPAARDAASTAT